MALKIPEAPGIVSSDIEMRSPHMVSPVSETPNLSKVDFSDVQREVGDVTKYYQDMVRDQTNTYMTALKTAYFEHMTNTQNDVFQERQGKDATDLYARFLKPESDKWLKDRFGDPKDDGEIRIADKKLQDEFTQWVISQQPHFISSTANYEEREWDKFRTTAFQSRDTALANMVMNATSPETIQNAIDGFVQNTYQANPGMDEDSIKQTATAKIDTSLLAYVNKKAETKPITAFYNLRDWEPLDKNMTAISKQQALETIRKSYLNIAIDEQAKFNAKIGGSVGMTNNWQTIGLIFGDDKIKQTQAEILSKAQEKATAYEKQMQGQKDVMMNGVMQDVLSARNEDEFERALMNVQQVDDEAGRSILNAHNSFVATQQAYDSLNFDASGMITDIEETMKPIGTEREVSAREDFVKNLEGRGLEEHGLEAFKYTLGIQERPGADVRETIKRVMPGTKFMGETTVKDWRKHITQEDLDKAAAGLTDKYGSWNKEKLQAAAYVWKDSMKKQDQMPRYKELSGRISSGEIQSYDASLMGDLDWAIQQQLLYQIKTNNEYLDTKRTLKDIGVDLDKVAQDTGTDAQYSGLDVGSQNLLKRNFVYEVNSYKATHSGALPDEEACQGIMYRVQKNSRSPAMAMLQDVALAENLSSENLTDDQRYEMAVRESLKWDVNKPAKRGLSDQLSRAEDAIDRLANSTRLSRSERNYIKINRAYLVPMLQAGDIVGIANFIGLATQGGF